MLKKLKREFLGSVTPGTGSTMRLHSLLQKFVLLMGSSLVPSDPTSPRSPMSTLFLLSRSFVAWSNLVEIPRLPNALRGTFLVSFAHALTKCVPNLKVLRLDKSPGIEAAPVILVGEMRAVRNCKCLTFVSLELVERRNRVCVKGDAWVVTLPRHSNASLRKRKSHRYNDQALFEKDSAGLDVLAFDSHVALSLRRLLFDFVSAVAARDPITDIDGNHSMDLARGALSLYDLPAQIKALVSNYKIYETHIIFRSYGDPLLARFEAPEVFEWLHSHAEGQGLVPCGSQGVRFQRKVQCRGTTSAIFLRYDAAVTDRLVLMVLCRTQGRDLREFMFPNGAIVGVSVMDYIAIEAAGMIYEHLKAAANHLHLSHLWQRASTSSTSRRRRELARASSVVTDDEIRNLLRLCTVTPLAALVRDPLDVDRLNAILDGGTDWRRCLEVMANDPAFSPSWPVTPDMNDSGGGAKAQANVDDCGSAILFYLPAEDAFLLVRTRGGGGGRLEASVVQRPESPSDAVALVSLAQMLANYFLHFIWSELM
jgi:hypothetical protein